MEKNQNKNTDPNKNDANDEAIGLNPSQTTDKSLIQTTYLRNDQEIQDALNQLDELYFFIRTAPVQWSPRQLMRRYYLTEELGFMTCILWNNLFYITGTDIVKSCIYQMELFGRQIVQRKKFEEGIFSDLRNLKCGKGAILEQPKSNFLNFLFKNICLKTQKKQKIFFWFHVPHLQLFIDALSRDLKREESNQLATTKAISEPALSFKYNSNSNISLMDQLIAYLNHGKSNGFTNMVSDLDDDNTTTAANSNDNGDSNSNSISISISNSNSNSNNTTYHTTNSNCKRSRSNTNRFTKKEKRMMKTSKKPNLSLRLNKSSTNNHPDTENTSTTTNDKISIIQSNYNSANDNNNKDNHIVTHTLILHDNSKTVTYNNGEYTPDISPNNFNEHFMRINNYNNKHNIIVDENTKTDDSLLSPLNIGSNNDIDNLNDQDFPLDYLPIIDDVLAGAKQEKNKITPIPLPKGIPNLNINKNQPSHGEPNNNNEVSSVGKEEEEEGSDDENIVVPVTVGNSDKNNRYSKPFQFHNLLSNMYQMTNKEYYMLNKMNPILNGSKNDNSNEIEVPMVPYDIESKKSTSINNTNINNRDYKKSFDENTSIRDDYKDEYPVNEPTTYDQHEDFYLHPTLAQTNLKITDPLSIQENPLNIHDEYVLRGNTILPFQPYNISMNHHVVLAPVPPHQAIYNNSITPVTKFSPYIGHSPWGPQYLSNSLYGINSPPGLGHSVSQSYQTHSINPFSRPSSSINEQFSINKSKIGDKINIQSHNTKSMESTSHKIKRQKK